MKTGGQTLLWILRRNFGMRHCDTLRMEDANRRDWKWMRTCYPGMRSICGHCLTPHDPNFREVFPDARIFMVLRDPGKRAISHYQFRYHNNDLLPRFGEWLDDYGDFMCRRICGEPNADKAIETIEKHVGFVGLLEHYDESVVLWKRWTGLPDLDIRYVTVNEARDNTVRDTILANDSYVEKLHQSHREDQKLYDWVASELYPRQKRDFGPELETGLQSFLASQETLTDNQNLQAKLGRLKRNSLYRLGVRSPEKHAKRDPGVVAEI